MLIYLCISYDCYNSRVEELWQQNYIASKNENIYYLAHQEKNTNSWPRVLNKFNEFSEFQTYSFMPPITSNYHTINRV